MLLDVSLVLRLSKRDGSAISQVELARLGLSGPFAAEGLGEEERSVNITALSLALDSFHGPKPSEKFFDAIEGELKAFDDFLSSIDEQDFLLFLEADIDADLLLSFKSDEDTLDFNVPRSLVRNVARLNLALSILVNPE
jgi:hypothetical protein